MSSNTDTKQPAGATDLLLEQAACGELSEAALAALDPATRAEVERLVEDSEQILKAYLPRREVLAILRKLDAERRKAARARRRVALAAAPACAAVLLFAVVQPGGEAPRAALERTKGPAILQVFRKAEGGEERLSPGARVAPGDVLQLRYDARGRRYGAIVSIDGAGVVTPHLPDSLQGPAASLDRALVPLPSAYELDDAPGYERFYFVTSSAPFDVEPVARAVRALGERSGPLPLPDGLEQVSIRVDKATP